MAIGSLSTIETELLRQKVKALRDRNLTELTFERRTDLLAELGIKVVAPKDLKSIKIFYRDKLVRVNDEKEQTGFVKLVFDSAYFTFASFVQS
jgi:hypothetical protein